MVAKFDGRLGPPIVNLVASPETGANANHQSRQQQLDSLPARNAQIAAIKVRPQQNHNHDHSGHEQGWDAKFIDV